MGWEERRDRRRIVEEVLRRVEANPEAAPSLDGIPGAQPPTGSDSVWLELQEHWIALLTGQLGWALCHADDNPNLDRSDAVVQAWQALAAQQPTLRRLLDSSTLDTPAMRAAAHREARLLANSAKSAVPAERPARTAETSSVFRRLIRRVPGRSLSPVPVVRKRIREALAASS